jgi:hypothetical protein
MIKATARGADGRPLLVIGLSYGNLDKFRAAPRDTFIKIDGKEMGLPLDVMIFSGETEAAMTEVLAGGIGPETKINISDKLK